MSEYSSKKNLKIDIKSIEKIIKYEFNNKMLLKQAFIYPNIKQVHKDNIKKLKDSIRIFKKGTRDKIFKIIKNDSYMKEYKNILIPLKPYEKGLILYKNRAKIGNNLLGCYLAENFIDKVNNTNLINCRTTIKNLHDIYKVNNLHKYLIYNKNGINNEDEMIICSIAFEHLIYSVWIDCNKIYVVLEGFLQNFF